MSNLIHVTREGDEKLLCEMSDNHLTNHINLLLNNAEACKNLINSGSGSESVTEIIYGVSKKDQIRQAKAKIKAIYHKVTPYIMEASIREIHFGERLREVFDRKKSEESNVISLNFRIDSLLED